MRRVDFRQAVLAMLVMLAGVVWLNLVACHGNQRQDTLRASVIAVNTARDGFLDWYEHRQDQIIDEAPTKEEGRAKLDAFRKSMDAAFQSFEATYRSLAIASTQSDEASLHAALGEADKLYAIVKRLMGGK